jgi:hypothetical protein
MKNITQNDQEKLFDLIESKDFCNLSIIEKEFVLNFLSEDDYLLQRKIILNAATIFDTNIEAKPLIINPSSSSKIKTIPLYQAILAVASVIVVFLIIWPKENTNQSTKVQIAENSTDSIREKIIHDTVLKYVVETKIIEKIKEKKQIEYISQSVFNPGSEPKLLEVSPSFILPELSNDEISSTINSLKNDNSSRFILPIRPFSL